MDKSVKEEALKTGGGLFFGGVSGGFKAATSPIAQIGSIAYGIRGIGDVKNMFKTWQGNRKSRKSQGSGTGNPNPGGPGSFFG